MASPGLAARLAQDALYLRTADILRSAEADIWLVGGAVRDALLGRPIDDLDLAVSAGALRLGRQLARALDAAFYPLDAARGVGRIILPEGGRHIDIADLRAADITSDLHARDFTINALAWPLREPHALLDPTGGLADLCAGVLRVASPRAFADDPLRILRLVRQGLALAWRAEPDTLALIPAALPLLATVALERVRDELVLLLALPAAADGLQQLGELGVLDVLYQRLGWPADAANPLIPLARLERWLADQADSGVLAAWRPQLAADWAAPLADYRPRRTLLKLAGWLAGLAAEDQARGCASRLALSARENAHIGRTLAASRALQEQGIPDAPLGRYLYFRRFGAAGLDGAVLAAAAFSLRETPAGDLHKLFAAWYTRYDTEVAPRPLLSGAEIIARWGIPPGPRVGELLELLTQAQVQGSVSSVPEAIVYLDQVSSSAL